jgi:hypothetical protein
MPKLFLTSSIVVMKDLSVSTHISLTHRVNISHPKTTTTASYGSIVTKQVSILNCFIFQFKIDSGLALCGLHAI